MAKTRADLISTGNTRTGALRRLSAAGAGGVDQVQSGSRLRSVRVDSIAPNPDNPVTREDEKLPPLRASIEAMGMLKPILVTPRATWMSTNPDKPVREDAEWVNIDGHRRLAIARELALEVIEVLVDEQAATNSDAIMVATNSTALKLRPIEEAAAYQRELDKGLSQRKVAERMGVSAATVNKRVALLKLPDELQQLINLGLWSTSEAAKVLTFGEPVWARVAERLRAEGALELAASVTAAASEDDDETAPVSDWRFHPFRMCHDAKQELAQEAATLAAQTKAEELGVPAIASREELYSDWSRRSDAKLTREADIEAARERGALVVAPNPFGERLGEEPVYYLQTDLPAPQSKAAQADHRLAPKSRRNAEAARAPYVTKLLKGRVSAETFRHAATALTVREVNADYRAWRKAEELWTAIGHVLPDTSYRPLHEVDPDQRELVMWFLYVAAMEVRLLAAPDAQRISAVDEEYLAALAALGYSNSDWETARLESYHAKKES